MNGFNSLFKVQFLSLFGFNKRLHKKGKMFGGLIGLILLGAFFAAVFVYVGVTYSGMFADLLELTPGGLDRLFPAMLAVTALATLFYSFYSSGSTLYGYKDYELISALPVKPVAVVFSKLAIMFLGNILFSLLIFIPAFFVYSKKGGVLTPNIILTSAVLLVSQLFLALTVGIIIGFIISLVSSLFARKDIAQTVIFSLLLIGLVIFMFTSSNADGDLLHSIKLLWPAYYVAEKAFEDPLYILIFVAMSLGGFAIVSTCICLTYRKLNGIMMAKRTKNNFKMKNYRGQSQFGALLGKEGKRFISTPIWVINTAIGGFFYVLSVVFIVSLKDTAFGREIAKFLFNYLPVIAMLIFIIGPTTAASISMEGNSFWIVKTSPVSFRMLFSVKILFNFVIYTVFSVVSVLVIGLVYKLSFLNVTVRLLNLLSIVLFASVVGLFFNVLFPVLKWETPNKPVKQSLSVFLCLATSFVTMALFITLLDKVPLFKGDNGYNLLMWCFTGFFFVVSGILYAVLMASGEKILSKRASV